MGEGAGPQLFEYFQGGRRCPGQSLKHQRILFRQHRVPFFWLRNQREEKTQQYTGRPVMRRCETTIGKTGDERYVFHLRMREFARARGGGGYVFVKTVQEAE